MRRARELHCCGARTEESQAHATMLRGCHVLAELGEIRGTLVEYPLGFLQKEDLRPPLTAESFLPEMVFQ